MDYVATHVDAEVATDSARLRVKRFGSAKHFAAGSDSVITFPYHSADGAGRGVINEALEEAFGGEVRIMLFKMSTARLAKLHSDKLEAFGFKAGNYLANKSSLHAIGFDHDESSLFWGRCVSGLLLAWLLDISRLYHIICHVNPRLLNWSILKAENFPRCRGVNFVLKNIVISALLCADIPPF